MTYFNMKKDGHINETILLGKSYSEKMCKDKEAYLKKALPAVLGFGIVSILYGIVDCIHWYVNPMEMVDTVGGISFYGSTGGICSVYDATEKENIFRKIQGEYQRKRVRRSDSLLTSYKLQK